MNGPMARGACPSLSRPMQTGDGLLVRLRPLSGGLAPALLGQLAEAAGRFGNGIVEVTRRGNLQMRGLMPESAVGLADTVDAMGLSVSTGVPVETGPLAGLDAGEIADPRPLVSRIRTAITEAGLASRLGPKVSVVVDGGGALPMDGVAADVRAVAHGTGRWRVTVGGGECVSGLSETQAVKAVISLLEAIAAKGLHARGRDLSLQEIMEIWGNVERRNPPVGVFPLKDETFALGLGLPFGQASADKLRRLADVAALHGACEIRFAPGRALLAIGLSRDQCDDLQESADQLGFVTDPADPRLFISACAGSPACASAFIATKEIAADLATTASSLLDGSFTLHVSGCPKGCARPPDPLLSLVGVDVGQCELALDGRANGVIAQAGGGDAAAHLAELALLFCREGRPGETARAFIARSQTADLASVSRRER